MLAADQAEACQVFLLTASKALSGKLNIENWHFDSLCGTIPISICIILDGTS